MTAEDILQEMKTSRAHILQPGDVVVFQLRREGMTREQAKKVRDIIRENVGDSIKFVVVDSTWNIKVYRDDEPTQEQT